MYLCTMTESEQKELDRYKFFIDFFLPANILDYYSLVKMSESDPTEEEKKKGVIYSSVLDVFLDERDNRNESQQDLRANGFTEPTVVDDFPIRDRKVRLHIRRRRWLDKDGKSVILDNEYPIRTDGTRYSPEFAAFLKEAHGLGTGHGEELGADLLR